MAYYFMRLVSFIAVSLLIAIGCLIGFFATWHTGPLVVAVIIIVINFIIICAISEQLGDFMKWLSNGIKTGEWH